MEFFSNVRFKFVAPAEDMPTMPGCDTMYLPPCFIVAVTVSEVADIMRVSKMTVYRLIHSGEMPAIRVGKSFRVPESAVGQLIRAGLTDHIDERVAGING